MLLLICVINFTITIPTSRRLSDVMAEKYFVAVKENGNKWLEKKTNIKYYEGFISRVIKL